MNFINAISWFEIPAIDLDRATRFYETIFDVKLIPMDVAQVKMRMFPMQDPMQGIGGALTFHPDFYQPSSTAGPLIYLNANPDLQQILIRVETAGGKTLLGKTPISPEHGYMALLIDSEGNRVALHSVG
jgi:hypothetical protein